MRIIPVVDLAGGVVVHARRGERNNYRPLQTDGFPSADPLDVVRRILNVADFRTLYIADLDRISGTGDQTTVIAAIREGFPHLALWLDRGWSNPLTPPSQTASYYPVIGTESLTADLWSLLRKVPPESYVLSLDQLAGNGLGPAAAWADRESWPRRVIAMCLDRVGSDTGPALSSIAELVRAYPERAIYAAGGVRHEGDLEALATIGAAGALVASAIYQGSLGSLGAYQFGA